MNATITITLSNKQADFDAAKEVMRNQITHSNLRAVHTYKIIFSTLKLTCLLTAETPVCNKHWRKCCVALLKSKVKVLDLVLK